MTWLSMNAWGVEVLSVTMTLVIVILSRLLGVARPCVLGLGFAPVLLCLVALAIFPRGELTFVSAALTMLTVVSPHVTVSFLVAGVVTGLDRTGARVQEWAACLTLVLVHVVGVLWILGTTAGPVVP